MSDPRWEIRQVVEAYAAAADRADGDGIAALFTPEGVLAIWMDPTTESSRVRTGRAEIATAIRGLSAYRATQHSISSHVATVDGDSARGETRCVAHRIESADGHAHDRVLYIRYDDDYVHADEHWLIARRELHVQWTSIQPVETE
jgi:uncharacterized protein (TIGR02246 family)